MIKLILSDVDGTLTDCTIYVSDKGESFKQFSMIDGMGFRLLKNKTKVKTGLITSEKGGINKVRALKLMKLKVLDYFIDDSFGKDKLEKAKHLCNELNIKLNEVAFIGDDINDKELLEAVKYKACPNDAHSDIKSISQIKVMKRNGGKGAVREFIDYLIKKSLCDK